MTPSAPYIYLLFLVPKIFGTTLVSFLAPSLVDFVFGVDSQQGLLRSNMSPQPSPSPTESYRQPIPQNFHVALFCPVTQIPLR